MSSLSSRRGPTGVRAAAVVVLIAVGLAPGADAQSSPGLPSPRVTTLTARVVTLQPRVVSVAPQQTTPNKFTVNSDVLFAFNASNLSSNAHAVLAGVVQHLQAARPGRVSIVGYTDSIGTPEYNLGLSQRRAVSVEAYLQAHVHTGRLSYQTKGLGEANPVAPNALPGGQGNPAGRQRNRRVVIRYAPR